MLVRLLKSYIRLCKVIILITVTVRTSNITFYAAVCKLCLLWKEEANVTIHLIYTTYRKSSIFLKQTTLPSKPLFYVCVWICLKIDIQSIWYCVLFTALFPPLPGNVQLCTPILISDWQLVNCLHTYTDAFYRCVFFFTFLASLDSSILHMVINIQDFSTVSVINIYNI